MELKASSFIVLKYIILALNAITSYCMLSLIFENGDVTHRI